MRILMIGQRGVPATFGGIERAVEELGAELVRRGHEVEVLCRAGYTKDEPESWRGMRLRYLPTVESKHLEAFVHSGLGALTGARRRPPYDIVHFHALGPGLFTPVTRWMSGSAVVQTIHGLDDQRAKWGGAAQRVLGFGHFLSARVPHATITVSQALADAYARRWQRTAYYVPNGVRPPGPVVGVEELLNVGVEPGKYVLFVGRLVPEKAVDVLLRAFRALDTDHRLVVAGGSSHTDGYVDDLHRLAAADDRVHLAGYVYGDTLRQLYANASAFVLPSLLEGLPLALLEAASYGVPIVASDIEPHLEVLGGQDRPGRRLTAAGDTAALTAALERVLANGPSEHAGATELRREVLATYDWAAVAERTEAVYTEALERRQLRTARRPEPTPEVTIDLTALERAEPAPSTRDSAHDEVRR